MARQKKSKSGPDMVDVWLDFFKKSGDQRAEKRRAEAAGKVQTPPVPVDPEEDQYPGDYHCGNCEAIGCKQHGFYSQYPEECEHVTHSRGCASHSRLYKRRALWWGGATLTDNDLRMMKWLKNKFKGEEQYERYFEIVTQILDGIKSRQESEDQMAEIHDLRVREEERERIAAQLDTILGLTGSLESVRVFAETLHKKEFV